MRYQYKYPAGSNWPYEKVIAIIESNLTSYYESNTPDTIYKAFSACGRGWCGLPEFELLHEQWLTRHKL